MRAYEKKIMPTPSKKTLSFPTNHSRSLFANQAKVTNTGKILIAALRDKKDNANKTPHANINQNDFLADSLSLVSTYCQRARTANIKNMATAWVWPNTYHVAGPANKSQKILAQIPTF